MSPRPASSLRTPAAPRATAPRILHEDEDLVAVDKPPGLPMHANLDPHRQHLVGVVQELLERRLGRTVRLGIHQRLDLGTSGVVMFTLSPRANPGLARQFEAGTVRKTYLALTVPPPTASPLPRAWTERQALAPPLRRGGPMRGVERGGQAAETRFYLHSRGPGALLIEARPRTGRKHQVRAHLAGRGMPLLGDPLYGGPTRWRGLTLDRPLLHALRLELEHPVTGQALVLESPPPEDFERCLAALAPRRTSRSRPRR